VRRITRNPIKVPRVAQAEPPNNDGSALQPLAVRVPDAVKMTGIGRSKLYELIKEGAIDVVKIGAITIIPVASLEALLEKNRQ
jgi:hypothetical protein